MDLIATLEILADAVNQLAELAQEQATIIEQYQMIDKKGALEHRERLAALDEKLMHLGTFAWKRKEKRE